MNANLVQNVEVRYLYLIHEFYYRLILRHISLTFPSPSLFKIVTARSAIHACASDTGYFCPCMKFKFFCHLSPKIVLKNGRKEDVQIVLQNWAYYYYYSGPIKYKMLVSKSFTFFCIRLIPNWSSLDGYHDPENACNSLIEKYSETYNVCFPVRKLTKKAVPFK